MHFSFRRSTHLTLTLLVVGTQAWSPPGRHGWESRRSTLNHPFANKQRLFVFAQDVPTAEEKVATIKAEAERIRKEAEVLERTLTQDKISSIQQKLSNKSWLKKNPSQQERLERELKMLEQKLTGPSSPMPELSVEAGLLQVSEPEPNRKLSDPTTTSTSTSVAQTKQIVPVSQTKQTVPETPQRGFDEDDLEVYIPVAQHIETSMPNATIQEKLTAFRKSPELQQHFQNKIKTMLVKPMEDLKRLDELRNSYLSSQSKVERTNIRREIDQLQKALEDSGPVAYSESVFVNISPMAEAELETRTMSIAALPNLLQVMFKQRVRLEADADLSLAILLDYYEQQLQLLEQIGAEGAITEDNCHEPLQALESLPTPVRDHIARKNGLEDGSDLNELLTKLTNETAQSGLESSLRKASVSVTVSKEEYDDIDFIDRSRYAEKFFPALARLEAKLPSQGDIDAFVSEVVKSKEFMMRSRPERVIGGYYVRGYNVIDDDESGVQLVQRLTQRLEASPLKDRVDFFYMNDPAPLSEEDFEMEMEHDKIIFVTVKDRALLCQGADGFSKLAVTTLGVSSIALFAVLTSAPSRENIAGFSDLLNANVLAVAGSIASVQLAHEAGHWAAALQHNMTLGVPSVVPLATGLGGAITPLKSPPPSFKALFDVAVAGPVTGFLASVFLLVFGLSETARLDFASAEALPVMPISVLRSSALGAGLIDAVLGKGALMSGVSLPQEATLPVHPAAIGGFVGLITSALALLPIGNTDGGRMGLAVFGRRWSYLVSTVAAIVLCLLGLFGLDKTGCLVTYAIFAVVWQRELELPARNEVEELDLARGFVAIAACLLMFLTLIPML